MHHLLTRPRRCLFLALLIAAFSLVVAIDGTHAAPYGEPYEEGLPYPPQRPPSDRWRRDEFTDDDPVVRRLVLIELPSRRELGTVTNETVIDLSEDPSRTFTMRAEVRGPVQQVHFQLNAITRFRVELSPPYTLAGKKNGVYHPWRPKVGRQRVKVTPYRSEWGRLVPGVPLEVEFRVIGGAPGERPRDAPPRPALPIPTKMTFPTKTGAAITPTPTPTVRPATEETPSAPQESLSEEEIADSPRGSFATPPPTVRPGKGSTPRVVGAFGWPAVTPATLETKEASRSREWEARIRRLRHRRTHRRLQRHHDTRRREMPLRSAVTRGR